jgi:putative ABC transport system permease protein
MKSQPPKRALQFLRWFCREDYLEEFEGDLIELFEQQYENSPAKAKRKFFLGVMRSFRPGFMKAFYKDPPMLRGSKTTAMFKNNLKVAWRNALRQPFFTFLNTSGLAIGMAGALIITLLLHDELSFDKMFADADRIYRVNIDNRTAGETNHFAAVSSPLADVMRKDFSQAEMITRLRMSNGILLKEIDAEQNVKEDHVAGADATFFKMFGLEMLYGNAKTALEKPNSIVLTKTAALKHFDLDKSMGQSMVLNNNEVYIVTGVIEDLPQNSFLRDQKVFISLSSFADFNSLAWSTWSFPTFVKLRSQADEASLQAYLGTVKERYLIPWAMTFMPGLTVESAREMQKSTGDFMRFTPIALTDIHLHSPNIDNELSANSDIQNVYILAAVGLFLILLAVVNFMNLSTARSLKRAKEVGVRKTLGSSRWGLIKQFLTESTLVAFVALVLAIAIAAISLPYFNQLAGKAIAIPFGNPLFWLILCFVAFVLGFGSGSYPAFLMSRFSPIKGMKGGDVNGNGGRTVINSLVVVQFAISLFLMLGTFVVFQQLNFIQNKDLGYQKDQVLIIDDVDAIGKQIETFKNEVKKMAQVKNASLSSYLPTPSPRGATTLFPDKSLGSENALIIGSWDIDYDYLSTLGLELVAGRDFNREFATDSSAMILNESTAVLLGLTPEEVIGMRFTDDFHREDKENMRYFTVIGVVKNFHFETLRNSIDALCLTLGGKPKKMLVKLNAGDFSKGISKLETAWEKFAPGQPFNYYFMDDSFNNTYDTEQRLGKIFVIFTSLSIFIACLGLFGLSAFNAEKRAKEISIRKVLGASIGQITYKLSIDFLKLVGLAAIVSLPLAGYFMNRWLQDFSYRIEIPWWVYLLTALTAVVISILTVSFQSTKAAMTSPIKALKQE